MSDNWFKDMQAMHKKYGVNKWMQAERQSDVDWRKINKFMQFRLGMMQEASESVASSGIDADKVELMKEEHQKEIEALQKAVENEKAKTAKQVKRLKQLTAKTKSIKSENTKLTEELTVAKSSLEAVEAASGSSTEVQENLERD